MANMSNTTLSNLTLWFSPEQEDAIQVTERVSSTLSIVGSLFVIVTFASSRRFRKPINRLLFYATVGNLFMSAGAMISFAGIYQGQGSVLCQTQGFLIQWFLPADALWNLSMAINVYLTIFKHYDSSRLRSLELVYNLVNFGLPLIIALAYCFVSTSSRGKMYGPAVLWCWVSSKWDAFRLALLYAPAWIAILSSFCIYLAAGLSIYRKRNELRYFRRPSAARPRGLSSAGLRFHGKATTINKTTEVRTLSEPRDGHIEEESFNMEYRCTAEALPEEPNSEYVAPQISSYPTIEANAAAWGYTKVAMLFFLSLLITWVPSTVFRVFSVVHPDIHNFPLALTAALVLPLQGVWNCIIYVITSWDAVKAWYFEGILRQPPKLSAVSTRSEVGRRYAYNASSSSGDSQKRTVPLKHGSAVHDSQEEILGAGSSSTRSSILLAPVVADRPSIMLHPEVNALSNTAKSLQTRG